MQATTTDTQKRDDVTAATSEALKLSVAGLGEGRDGRRASLCQSCCASSQVAHRVLEEKRGASEKQSALGRVSPGRASSGASLVNRTACRRKARSKAGKNNEASWRSKARLAARGQVASYSDQARLQKARPRRAGDERRGFLLATNSSRLIRLRRE